MKTRDFEREILSNGAVFLGNKDSHHVYRLPNGERFEVPAGGCHAELKPYLVRKYRRLAGRRRADAR